MKELAQRFEAHERAWRDPMGVAAQWSDASAADADLLRVVARGNWWDVLAASGVTLIVTREYEHLVLAIGAAPRPRITYMRLPHPSGVAFDERRNRLYIAATRNPNQIFEFGPAAGLHERADIAGGPSIAGTLVPTRSWYLPGCTYLHDLAFIGGTLHGNAVGSNTVIQIDEDGGRPVWWPRALERNGAPVMDRNYIQLNSIAAGADLASSFFSASSERPGRFRPGHARYPVDRRGVLFSGSTREPVVRGLTRPHSARLRDGRVWVANSGYGELGVGGAGSLDIVARLPGWTRGLAFVDDVAFVGTSRVIPRFAQYAPGVDVAASRCAIVAIDTTTGSVRGSLEFPAGNQIFAIEPVSANRVTGFPFSGSWRAAAERRLFYAYVT